jgi:flagellar biosynthesis protein FliQ
MSPTDALDLIQFTMWTVIIAAAPAVLPAMLVGVVVAFLQALTQIQEATLTFVPKIMVVFISIAFFANYMGAQVNSFVIVIFDRIESGF